MKNLAELDRLSLIREDVMKRGGSFIPDVHPFAHDLAAWRAMKQDGSSVVQARAAFLLEEVKAATIRIYPHWRLAGEHLIPGQWGHSFGLMKDNPPVERLAELGVDPKQAPEIKEAASRFVQRGNSPLQAVGRAETKNQVGVGNWSSANVVWAVGWVENHSIRDYAKVLRGVSPRRQRYRVAPGGGRYRRSRFRPQGKLLAGGAILLPGRC